MKVTVLLVVRNCEKYISECIQSILTQTFDDFELLIVDDASTDNTLGIIRTFKDKRIQTICMERNNYIEALNIGLKKAKGKYIARMDGDDIMFPHRLEKQVHLMESDSNIHVCSSWYECFGISNNICKGSSGKVQYPLLSLLLNNILAHPTTMLRKSFLRKHQITYKEYYYAEDYKLWSDIAIAGGNFYVMPEILLKYRRTIHQISYIKSEEQSRTAFQIKQEILEHLLLNHFETDKNLIPLYEILASYNNENELSGDAIIRLFAEIFNLKMRKK